MHDSRERKSNYGVNLQIRIEFRMRARSADRSGNRFRPQALHGIVYDCFSEWEDGKSILLRLLVFSAACRYTYWTLAVEMSQKCWRHEMEFASGGVPRTLRGRVWSTHMIYERINSASNMRLLA